MNHNPMQQLTADNANSNNMVAVLMVTSQPAQACLNTCRAGSSPEPPGGSFSHSLSEAASPLCYKANVCRGVWDIK